MSAHAPVGNLCVEDHFCPNCEVGMPVEFCMDLFMSPTCGIVACCADEGLTAKTSPCNP